MAYLLLIAEPGSNRRTRPVEKGRDAQARMIAFGDDLRARGRLLASESLKSDAEGVRIRAGGDGQRRTFDGPFAESKEIIGGFFLLDCDSREEALTIAHECPAVEWGATVEVREIGPCYDE